MKSILKAIFCISSSVALAHGETAIGKKSVGKGASAIESRLKPQTHKI